jgi:hypothetical protein
VNVGDEWAERIERSLRWTYRSLLGLVFAVVVLVVSLWAGAYDSDDDELPVEPVVDGLTCADLSPVLEALRLTMLGQAESLRLAGVVDQAEVLEATAASLGLDVCPIL